MARTKAQSQHQDQHRLFKDLLVSCGMALHNWSGGIAILLTSFFMAPMFPTIFAIGIKDLGPATKIGGSLLVMAVIGVGLPDLLYQVDC